MSFIRSHLVIAIVSLFVLTGYGFDLFADCSKHHESSQTENGKSAPRKGAPSQKDDCQCICHQIVSPLNTQPLRVAGAEVVSSMLAVSPDKFPPDAVPLGIDYPPQLA